MQLMLILGIAIAIGAVIFALQNNTPAIVTVGLWSFEGSLALVLLVALALGALIAGLVSSPAMIRRQWNVSRLSRQVAELERKLVEESRRSDEMRAELSRARGGHVIETATEPEEKPYVGLRALMAGDDDSKASP